MGVTRIGVTALNPEITQSKHDYTTSQPLTEAQSQNPDQYGIRAHFRVRIMPVLGELPLRTYAYTRNISWPLHIGIDYETHIHTSTPPCHAMHFVPNFAFFTLQVSASAKCVTDCV